MALLLRATQLAAFASPGGTAGSFVSGKRPPKLSGKSPAKLHKALEKNIQSLIAQSPAVAGGHIGFAFADLATGRLVAAQNADSYFTPASNTKLYTTAVALIRLGADYRFHTQLRTTGPWQPGQAMISDLQVIGGGDPNLSGRMIPYRSDAPEDDALAAVRRMVDQLYQAGVREVAGTYSASTIAT